MASYFSVICVLLHSLVHSIASFPLAGQRGENGCPSGTGTLPGQPAYGWQITIGFLCLWVYEEVGHSCLWEVTLCYPIMIFGVTWDPWALCPCASLKIDQWLQRPLGEKDQRTDKRCDCVCFISLGSQASKSFLNLFFIKLSLKQKIRCSSKRIALYTV